MEEVNVEGEVDGKGISFPSLTTVTMEVAKGGWLLRETLGLPCQAVAKKGTRG